MKTRRLVPADDRSIAAAVAHLSRIGRIVGPESGHRLAGSHEGPGSLELRRIRKCREVLFLSSTWSIPVIGTMIPGDSCSSAIACADHTG